MDKTRFAEIERRVQEVVQRQEERRVVKLDAKKPQAIYHHWCDCLFRYTSRREAMPPTAKILALIRNKVREWDSRYDLVDFIDFTIQNWMRIRAEIQELRLAPAPPPYPYLQHFLNFWNAYFRVYTQLAGETSDSALLHEASRVAAQQDIPIEDAVYRLAVEQQRREFEKEKARIRDQVAQELAEVRKTTAQKRVEITREDALYLLHRSEALLRKLEEFYERALKTAQELWVMERRLGLPPGEEARFVAEFKAEIDGLARDIAQARDGS